MEASDQLHVPASLSSDKENLLPTRWLEVSRVRGLVLTRWRKEKSMSLPGMEPWSPCHRARSLVIILTDLLGAKIWDTLSIIQLKLIWFNTLAEFPLKIHLKIFTILTSSFGFHRQPFYWSTLTCCSPRKPLWTHIYSICTLWFWKVLTKQYNNHNNNSPRSIL
jgi:hypothetical protein